MAGSGPWGWSICTTCWEGDGSKSFKWRLAVSGWPSAKAKAQTKRKETVMNIKNIKLLLTDVDGVLTNGKVFLGLKEEFVGFDIQDGIGHRLACCGELPVGWLSGRLSKPVERRAKHLRVPYLYQGKLDKLTFAQKLCRKLGLKLSQVAYIGDDLIDLPLLTRVGFSATVPYGRPEVKKAVHFVTRS